MYQIQEKFLKVKCPAFEFWLKKKNLLHLLVFA